MKAGWERTEPPAPLNLKQINEIIRPAFPGKRVISAERLGTGLSNSNYKIFLEESFKPYVVRLFRGDGEIADKETAIAKLVRETVPVADYIYADTSCSTYEQSWAVLEWKEGVLLRDVLREGNVKDTVSAAAAIGNTLAQIHSYTFPAFGFLDKQLKVARPLRIGSEQYLSLIEEFLFHSPCHKWLEKELIHELWTFCQTYSPLLSENDDLPVLVHSDFNGLNILMQNGRTGYSVSAVLDWEFAFSWSRYVDIANLLRYEEEGSIFEKHFIRAYQAQGGVLVDHWRLLSKLEDLVALCDMLSHSTAETPNRIRDLQRLIARSLKH